MRLFFALLPADGSARALAALAHRIAPATGGRPVAPANLHLTLLFLGEADTETAKRAVDAGDAAAAAWRRAIRVRLDTLGRFAGARVAWVGPAAVPGSLAALHEALRGAARASGLRFDARPFVPHVTLLRRALRAPPPEALPTPLSLAADRFALLCSDSGPDGVVYRPLRSWPPARSAA